jgi:predicted aspartyl protease
MIQGVVSAGHEAIVRLRVRGRGGLESVVDAIVDTGFTTSLALPVSIVTALGLIQVRRVRANLPGNSAMDLCGKLTYNASGVRR